MSILYVNQKFVRLGFRPQEFAARPLPSSNFQCSFVERSSNAEVFRKYCFELKKLKDFC